MLNSEKHRGLHLQAAGRLMLLLAVPIFIGLLMWFVAFRAEQRSASVEHTLSVQISIERLLVHSRVAGSSQRGFLATGEQHFLDSYHAAVRALHNEFAQLSTLTSDDPRQVDNLARLKPLLDRRLQQLDAGLQPRSGGARTLDSRGTLEQQNLLDSIESAAAEMYEEEEKLLKTREASHKAANNQFKWSLMLGYTIVVLIVWSLYRSAKLHSLETAEAQGKLTRLNAELDERVRQRTALLHAREEQLRESEATIRTLLDTASQAILAIDTGGSIVIANRKVGEMFGYAVDELIGQQHEILLPEKFRERHRTLRANFNADPRPRAMGIGLDLVGLRKNGTEFPIEVSLSSVATKQGLLAVSFVSDVTDRKKAETDLKESEQRLRALAGSLLTAQEDERRNLARELHDDVTQQLAFLSIELGRLAGELPPESQAHQRALSLQAQTTRASSEVRRLSHGLHPSVITDFGLGIALEEFCEEFQAAHGVNVEFEGLIEDSSLNDTAATSLYRIAQESLRNAHIHGRAKNIRVTLSIEDEVLQLQVLDDGLGFSMDAARAKAGLGITSMLERIRLVSGTLTVSPGPGGGTIVTASIPLTGGPHVAT
jgi:PAS domain S-box-containing protein